MIVEQVNIGVDREAWCVVARASVGPTGNYGWVERWHADAALAAWGHADLAMGNGMATSAHPSWLPAELGALFSAIAHGAKLDAPRRSPKFAAGR